MKKKIIALTALIATLTTTVSATPKVDFTLNTDTQELSAKIISDKIVTIQLLKQSDAEVTYQNISDLLKYATQFSVKGEESFVYPMKVESGKYQMRISDGDSNAWVKDFYFLTTEDAKNLIGQIKNASSSEQSIKTITEDNLEVIGIDSEKYDKVKDSPNINELYKWVISQNKFSSIEEYKQCIADAIILQLVNYGVVDDVKDCIENDLKLGDSAKNIFDNYVSDKEGLYSLIQKHTDFSSVDELESYCEKAVFLMALNESDYTKAALILEEGKEIVGATVYDKFSNLSPSDYARVSKAITGKNFYDYDTFVKAFNNALKNENNGNSQGGSGGSGGSGNSGGKNNNVQIPTPNKVIRANDTAKITQPETFPEFVDLENYQWAKDAIKSLRKAKVVYGKTEKEFAPQNQITREEFLAMLLRAFKIEETDADVPFDDVDNSAWYAKTVATAYKKGITNGIGENKFGIGRAITREEICALSYRIAKKNNIDFGEISDNPFKDGISDYSKESISAFYNAQIVSGVSDYEFMPKASATRAEAAKILYNLLAYCKMI